MGEMSGETIPILPACDIAATVEFYGTLGFRVVRLYEGFGAPYLIVRRDEVELHFFENTSQDPKRNDHGCYLRLADAQGVYDEWAPLGLTRLHPISDTPWGMREFSVSDPSGNLLRIGTTLPG
jgi:catechol 2,3-dioxygenase-like lactoylglutathione lyase family enzyme